MAPKKKQSDAWMDDGDSAHWVKDKAKSKKIGGAESNKWVEKPPQIGKTTRKKITTKK
jgi:hypothetical protein